jgi:hypothetical protein
MLHLVKLDRSYSPETIAVMTAAFDRVHIASSSLQTAIRESVLSGREQ